MSSNILVFGATGNRAGGEEVRRANGARGFSVQRKKRYVYFKKNLVENAEFLQARGSAVKLRGIGGLADPPTCSARKEHFP